MTPFRQIYEEYAQPVYRFLLTLTGSEDQAEELLSETFYQALLHIGQFQERCSLYTWLCQIGKNAWLRECRRSRRFQAVTPEALAVPDSHPSQEEQLMTQELYRDILEALKRLDDPYRDVFILHAMGRIKLREIAAMYGKSESWARVTYFRAKQRLLQEVSP